MFNFAALVSLALAATPALAAPVTPNAVGTISCRGKAHTDFLQLIIPSGAQLGLGVLSDHVAVGADSGLGFSFAQCDSSFMGYTSNNQTAYGQLRVSGNGKCVQADRRTTDPNQPVNFIVGLCSSSDDSSQLFSTFAFERLPGHGLNAKVTFVNGQSPAKTGGAAQAQYSYSQSTNAEQKYLEGRPTGANGSYLEFKNYQTI